MIETILAALVVGAMFCYSQMRYHEGVIHGFNEAEKICRKYHAVRP